MVEFHIDDCEEFKYLIKLTYSGGFPGFRFPEGQKPVINSGHDEFIFKKQTFSPDSLTGPDGET